MQYKEINSWTDLTDIPIDYHSDAIIFRGVENYTDFDLKPKIGRSGIRKNRDDLTDIEYSRDEDDKLMEKFKRESLPHLKIKPDITSATHDEDWLCIARHHGLPTRLLDWTQSPLIAAYFACKYSGIIDGEKVDAAIYGLKYEIPNNAGNLFNIEKMYIYIPLIILIHVLLHNAVCLHITIYRIHH